ALVKDQIFRQLSLPQAVKNAQDQAQKIYDDITKNKKKMEDIAKISLVDLKTTDYFSVNEDIPGLSPAFRDRAFTLKGKGDVAEPVQVFQDYAILQLADTKASEIPPFEKVQAKVAQKYRDSKAADLAQSKAQAFADTITSGTDLKAAADKEKLTMK